MVQSLHSDYTFPHCGMMCQAKIGVTDKSSANKHENKSSSKRGIAEEEHNLYVVMTTRLSVTSFQLYTCVT